CEAAQRWHSGGCRADDAAIAGHPAARRYDGPLAHHRRRGGQVMAQPTDEITYRMATTDDVDTLAQKRSQMETERHPDIQTDYAAYLAAARQDIRPEIERGAHIAFLAEAEGEVVACAILIWWTMLPSLTELHRKR